ncbi:sensor histidine kinase [Planktothrix sp. FACHB-1355]|uniref:Circadian input-output histidine kinase CikA n=1 Tax=Aerosakkonema funiforme FACHB-1375 TaxID=2949571 RepID=A0A926VHP2_9CYAN|nr:MULTISPECIES: sensor histidine kinase [Oscillatoriales]MBD2182892.1 sensor histidine kinase [Aerosakkonema funiforme FACHB-1375]MBD3558048.1 sensor histidine kinase [Planktothrix sp. FACHB-1355]
MFDPSQILAAKIDQIVEKWMDAVRKDKHVESAKNLSDTALSNSLTILLDQLVKALSHSQAENRTTIIDASVEHGTHRAKEGFDPAEITWEYSILRRVIFSEIEPELLQCPPQEITRALDLINGVIDEAISQCFKSYVEGRLEEIDRIQAQLSLTNQELKRLVRASQDSLAYMAHEFKTPLTAIIGFSDTFLRQQRKAVKSEDSLPNIRNIERVLDGGRHLLHIVNDALELARYESGQIKLNLVPTQVSLIIDEVTEMIKPLAQAKNLDLQVNCDRAPVEAIVDPLRLQGILINLLSNAVRYTDRGCVIIECLAQADQKWSIRITDTGIGIAPHDRERIFEPYSQAFGKDARRDKESTGLGLAIVARLVKLLQGEIHLDSQKGVGSTFTVTFPLQITA